MEASRTQYLPSKIIIISVILLLLLIVYSFRNTDANGIDNEEATVSICQVRVHFDESYGLDDRTLISLLATFKMHDFNIRQPVWGPSDTLLYLCEHRLKTGFKQTILEKELHRLIKSSSRSSGHLAWSCA